MKIGIISDSHGNIENLKRAIEIMRKEGVSYIVHLGDNYSDCDEILVNLRVPGVYDEEYSNRGIKHRVIKKIGGKRILFTHTNFSHENDFDSDLKPEELIKEGKVDIVAYGHTHIPEIKVEKGIIFINPGHLKNEDKRGYKPSFAIVEIKENNVSVKIINLNGEVIIEQLL